MILIGAIIRNTALEKTISALKSAGINGMTITEVKGLGEERDLYRTYACHTRLEILAPDEDEERIVRIILEQTSTGMEGDGVIMVHPVKQAIRIRKGAPLS